LGERFWFGEGYEQLHECEFPVLAQRSLFLPIGVPSSLWETQECWTGADKKILFVCPNCVTNPYYAAVYTKFKSEFGDLPHVIVGAQDVPVDDPHFAGFVSDAELARLYRECAVIYYHSTELRHVHYSPIEAAINGMPVVYYRDSLLGRLTDGNAGCVNTDGEARQVIERMLGEDDSLSVQISKEQRSLAFKFSDQYCKTEWLRNMESSGFMHALKSERRREVYKREVWRTLIKPLAGGLGQLPKRDSAMTAEEWAAFNPEDRCGESAGVREIDFAGDQLPSFVRSIKGLSFCESWGRWSNGDYVTFELNYLLEKSFRIVISGTAYGDNAGKPVYITVGSSKGVTTFTTGAAEQNIVSVDFYLRQPSNIIKIKIPQPVFLEGGRSIGIGLIKLRLEPIDTVVRRGGFNKLFSARTARLPSAVEWASSSAVAAVDKINSEIDFTNDTLPAFVGSIHGLSFCESWGRWSDGEEVIIKLNYLLENRFRIVISGIAYGDNAGQPVYISVGSTTRVTTFSANSIEQCIVDFSLRRPSNIIKIKVPQPVTLGEWGRSIGIGLVCLRVDSLDSVALERSDRLPTAAEWASSSAVAVVDKINSEIDFTNDSLPPFVDSIHGLSFCESWGRWSNGKEVSIKLNYLLENSFRIVISGIAYGDNAGQRVYISVGSTTRVATFSANSIGQCIVDFSLRRPSNIIKIKIPQPVTLEEGGRSIGIGLVRLRVDSLDSVTLKRNDRLPTAMEWATSATAEVGDRVPTIESGIDFTVEDYPPFVQSIKGLSEHGLFFGRRTVSRKVVIVLNHTIEGDFRLNLQGGAYGLSVGAPLQVKVGDARRNINFYNTLHEPQSISIDIAVSTATNIIEIYQSGLATLTSSKKDVGFGFIHLQLEPITSFGRSALHKQEQLEIEHDPVFLKTRQFALDATDVGVESFKKYCIDFSAKGYPPFIRNISGVFDQESWGRWTAGGEVNITLNKWIEGDVLLEFVGGGYGENIDAPVLIKVGTRKQTVRFVASPEMPTMVTAHFDVREKTNVIKIKVPYPIVPAGGTRVIGLGLVSLSIVVMPSAGKPHWVDQVALGEVVQDGKRGLAVLPADTTKAVIFPTLQSIVDTPTEGMVKVESDPNAA
jgi:hypothetical protein